MTGHNPSHFGATSEGKDEVADLETSQFPVDSVSWLEAVKFCNQLSERDGLAPYYLIADSEVSIAGGYGYRLPTEAEWEYTCRAGRGDRYCFGDDASQLPEYAWLAVNSDNRPHAVGQKKPNAFGLYDMHGNVWEYTSDHLDYKSIRTGTVNPQGDPSTELRGLRGGYYGGDDFNCRSAVRSQATLDAKWPWSGFRVARTISMKNLQPKGLLAYDGFAYPVGKLANENGGDGFRRGWTGLSSLTRPSNANVVDRNIGIEAGRAVGTGKSIMMEGHDTLSRGLVTKIDLSQVGSYYISLLTKRLPTGQPDTGGSENLAVILMNDEIAPIIDFGMSSGRSIHVRRFDDGKVTSQGGSPQLDGVTDDVAYLLLLQIEVTAASDGRVVAHGRIAGIPFREAISPEIGEVKWSGPDIELPVNQTIDRLRITNGQLGKYLVDELRIGTTYESVTGVTRKDDH